MSWRLGFKAQEPAKEKNWLDDVIVRQARKEDLPGMEWNGEYKHFRRVYAEAYQQMQRGHSILWLAEHKEIGLIGQVFIQLVCDRHELADGLERAYLYSFRVHQKYRGKGVGSQMMDHVEEDLIQRSYRYITLNVARDNPRAQQLYVRRGYYVVAPEPGIWSYPDENGIWHRVEEPAWRMEKVMY
ncbi:MAG: GNAT family N-acetyltransferase [Anaerolineaceae bacterium]|nr:GNAT family N-acetyltransferase [Anaerolineaceae bacterium]